MQWIIEYAPLILFFLAYKLADIYVATAVAILASLLAIAWSAWSTKKVSTMQWVSLAIIVIFGGATLLLHDETYIKWKPSVLYASFALILLSGRVFFDRDWIELIFRQAQIEAPRRIWIVTTWAWVAFLAGLAGLNLYIAEHYSLDTWVNFKVWWATGLFFVFMLGNVLWLARYQRQSPESDPTSSL